MSLSQIGWHFVGGFTEAECNKYFGLLNDTKPACINILGAAQYPQALEFAKTAAKVYPETRVIFRHMIPGDGFPGEDTGRWTKLSPSQWWTQIGSRYKNTGLTILLSNEDTMDDYGLYDLWLSECMTRAGDEGVAVAYLRFPTHHPRPGKQQQFDRTLKAAFKYPIHAYSPNIYWSAENVDGFKYPFYIINYAKSLGITLNTTIGEFALLRDIRDAHNGWRSCNISSKIYALDLLIKAKVHLTGIPVCVYSIGQWPIGADTFSLDDDALETIKANPTYLKPTLPGPTEPTPTPPVVITPPETPEPIETPEKPENAPNPPPLPVETQPTEAPTNAEAKTTIMLNEHLEIMRADYAKQIAELEVSIQDHQRAVDEKTALMNAKIKLKSYLDMALSQKEAA